MATTALDLVKQAMRQIGVLAAGEVPTADEGADALSTLNDMLALWSMESLGVTGLTTASGSLVVGQSLYLIGASGAQDWSNTRPLEVREAFYRQGTTDYPVLAGDERTWARTTEKTTNGPPSLFWYNPTYPDGTLQLDVPADSTDTFYYTAVVPLTSFTALSTTYALAPEIKVCLWSNLACLLAPEFEREPSQMLLATATGSKRALEAYNAARRAKLAESEFQATVPGRYSIDRGY